MSNHPCFRLGAGLWRPTDSKPHCHDNNHRQRRAVCDAPTLTNHDNRLFFPQAQGLLVLAEALASFNLCAQSSQHTSTVLPPIFTLMESPSSLQSHAAQVFSAMALSSATRGPGETSRPWLQANPLSKSLPIC